MPSNELGVRFTEEKYATKAEVVNDLHITAIDSFWSIILAFRSQFNRFSSLKTVDRELIYLCCCNSINALIFSAENKLLCLNREYTRVYQNADFLNKIKDFSSNRIKKIVENEHYFEALKFSTDHYKDANGEDYLADIFSKINNIDEITSFYRNNDSMTKENTAIIDRIYKCAPSALIENMMKDLFAFSVNDSFSSIIKAGLIFLYMCYIRPFDENYKEIAMLYAKSILAKNSIGDLAMLLPLEEIVFDDSIIENYIKQTQKTLDFTYYAKYFLERFIVLIDEFIDIFQNAEIPEGKTKGKQVVIVSEKESAAILNKYETQLLQEDPRLKKKEAHFYSRHHEIGRKYTINDYKRFNRCVYETARTSMDHLAEIGYYKKIQVKNKFVYETIGR